jgi:diaminohydroxyphosphoribosylaminopyrimidine deaminase/5-amino-6-(5-phosphoribosylamino)uracil reductase
MSQHIDDIRWMALALQEARHGLYTTDPNPRVGCVIVRNGALLGSGFHQRAGLPHAERNALSHLPAGGAKGAVCYVTLEPCCHVGRTEPCVDALIEAGVARVVVAMTDPNPKVAGKGIAQLRAAGIEVTEGVLNAESTALNPGFISRFTRSRPFVRVKLAMSLDGRTAMASGEASWITGTAAREDGQRLRARSSAVITGMGTLLADDPFLNVRSDDWQFGAYESEKVRQPLRVLLDSNGGITPNRKFFQVEGKTLVVAASKSAADKLTTQGLQAITLGKNGKVDLIALLAELSKRECNEVLVEAGATLAAAFIEEKLVDELVIYQAPVLLGKTAKPLVALDIVTMAKAMRLTLVDERYIGQDHRLTFRF